jgi:two-component system, LytTR family, response regulator
MKTKILIIDNEAPLRSSLRKLITHFIGESGMIQEASGVEDGLNKISSFDPDVVFLDIEMEDGTGFDLLKQLELPTFELIFTTAHNQYAIMAFEFSALNYLLKPISPSLLQKTLDKAIANLQKKNIHQQFEILFSQYSNRVDPNAKIALKDANGTYFVRISDIVYCEADGPYTKFHILGSTNIVISKTLKEYETIFEAYNFLRCHHSFLVNPRLITRYDRNESQLIMNDGSMVIVSQRKKDAVLEMLEKSLN